MKTMKKTVSLLLALVLLITAAAVSLTATAGAEVTYENIAVYRDAQQWEGGDPQEGGTRTPNEDGTLTAAFTADAWQYQLYDWSHANVDAITDDTVGIRFNLRIDSVGKEEVPLQVAFVMTDYVSWPKITAPITAQVGETAEYVILFEDVVSLDMLKKEIIFPIRYPEAYANTSLNKGFIMYGPPGTGKTLTAEALANETNAYFIKLNGLEMESKWVGESEENWRVLFDTARVNQPAVIFIDEFDAVAKKRGGVDVYGDKVVNQLLTLMSDVEKNGDDIYVIAATNRPEMLDSAITRSGRFGRSIEMKAPETVEDMINIFNIHTKGRKLDGKLDSKNLSERLLKAKATGADVAYVANKANEKALQRCGIYEKMENGTFSAKDMDSFSISNEDFIAAIDEFSKGRQKTERKPIGFVQYPAKHGATA